MNKFFLLSFSILISVGLISCGSDTENGGGGSGTSPQKAIFKYNQPNSISSLDPAFARSQNNTWAIHHLYNGLVELDEGLNIRPSISDRWTVSDDGKTLTFHIREDVHFHDHPNFPEGKGRKVVASDFVYSFGRILDENLGSPGAWIFKGRVSEEQPFEAPNDTTFVLNLKEAFHPIMGILTMQYCSVVPREVVEKFGTDFRKNPVGTGPFVFKKWLENQALFLEKNDNYFEKDASGASLPYLDGVKVQFIGDRKTAYLEFKKGNLDYMSGLESSYADELLTKEGEIRPEIQNEIQLVKTPFLNSEYLGVNLTKEDNPLKNKLVRQALNYGIDRDLMLKQLRNNVGKAADSGFTPRGLPSYDSKKAPGYSYDPEKAKALLKEAGFENGKGLPGIKLMTTKGYLDLCTFISRQWKDLGVDVSIESVESATLREMMSKGNVNFFRASWIADYPDGESFLTVFYGGNPAPPNYTRFNNSTFNELYEQALVENNNEQRMALYHQMEQILIEEAPVIFLFYDETAVFTRNGVSGISKNALNLLDLKRVKKP